MDSIIADGAAAYRKAMSESPQRGIEQRLKSKIASLDAQNSALSSRVEVLADDLREAREKLKRTQEQVERYEKEAVAHRAHAHRLVEQLAASNRRAEEAEQRTRGAR